MRRPGPAALVFAAALAAVAAGGDPAPPARATLALAAAPGKPICFLQTVETSVRPDMPSGREAPLPAGVGREKVVTELSLEILEERGGGFRAMVRVGRQTATLPDMKGDPVVVKSDEPLPKDPTIRFAGLTAVALGSTEFPAVLNAGGLVTEVAGCDAAVEARVKAMNVPERERMLVAGAIVPERVASLVNAALVATPLPGKEFAVGTAWKDEDAVGSVGVLDDIWICRALKVARVDAGDVQVEGPGTVAVRKRKPPKGIALGDLGGKPVAVKASKVATILRLSRVDALPVAVSTEAAMTYREAGAEFEVLWSWKCSVARVATWPSKND